MRVTRIFAKRRKTTLSQIGLRNTFQRETKHCYSRDILSIDFGKNLKKLSVINVKMKVLVFIFVGLIRKSIVNEQRPIGQFKQFIQKVRRKSAKVAPDPEATTRAVIAEFRKYVSTQDKGSEQYRKSSMANLNSHAEGSR